LPQIRHVNFLVGLRVILLHHGFSLVLKSTLEPFELRSQRRRYRSLIFPPEPVITLSVQRGIEQRAKQQRDKP
jgi:hypothetical protein